MKLEIDIYDKYFEKQAHCVLDTVADYWGVTTEYIRHHNRKRERVIIRQETQYLMKEMIPNITMASVGRFTGNGTPKDHATVVHAIRNVIRDLEARTFKGNLVDPAKAERIETLKHRIGENLEKLIVPQIIEDLENI